ncbi:hypothetical protein DZC78_09505 [Olleya aquimaris]|uniref:Uncharacterized protein n=1 Tax=Olleya sediminilitoris TaxID=2795739 RepID=A0ABS1WGT5_9FLAO|nr:MULTISPECIES: hypothetical protein [Olleya]AXO80607.1 hypothetical protein DZC78_09505 [Olleya aquimaris]MBL7558341.1 hypothetical protein [Olleya sediminilitoris]
MKNVNIPTIEKEQIKYLTFPKEELLVSKKEKAERCLTLKRAMVLGNLEHQKVRILFADSEGVKRVNTTIWGVTDEYVILKTSTIIPLERILEVA